MKFIKYLLFLLLIAFIGMAIYVAVQPNDFEVTETTTINAPKAVIFDIISDTSNVDLSSFWKDTETLKMVTNNTSDSIVQTFTSSRIKSSKLKWNLESNGDGSTTVTRSLDADQLAFMTKAKFVLFGDNKNELSQQFLNDLENLDKRVTKSMTAYSVTIDGVTDYGGGFYMYKTISSTGSNISATMAKQFGEISRFMDSHNISASGMPMTIYIEMNQENGNVIMSNAIPVSESVIVAEDSNILSGYMERTKALKVTLKGNYSNLKEAWATARKHLIDHNMEASEMSPFEIYKNDPGNHPNPAAWITELYIPIKEITENL
ncbi:GyrI-like domain-containing protein [Gelidibacter mesophilus]|uniref:GyrI-like domain-containing protein n=1 Tax=Gelidibacter mesophilus TaxID=169050 RepID=UPI000486D2B5|nr:GyrI-like domain-containing protein [Gelidibacter mesophilus]